MRPDQALFPGASTPKWHDPGTSASRQAAYKAIKACVKGLPGSGA